MRFFALPAVCAHRYPFVARKLLSSDRPELQQALQEVLYSGSSAGLGGDGTRGVITPTRLYALARAPTLD